MFFPWVGMFEQIRLADTYVHYDDVQFSKGSFVNRVQIKTSDGFKWLTIPLYKQRLGQAILEVLTDDEQDWRNQHLTFLAQTYRRAPYKDEMIAVVEKVYRNEERKLIDIVVAGLLEVCRYFGLCEGREFRYSSHMGVGGESSQRVVNTVKKAGGDVYITGHGAKNYLDHAVFEKNKIHVEYMKYRRTPYPQLYGAFNPHVSILDLIANRGKEGGKMIHSGTVYWKEFLK